MSYRLTLSAEQREAYDQWFNLTSDELVWQLRRKCSVPVLVAEVVLEKLKAKDQWARAQAVMLDAANKRIAWLESKVDPELLKHTRDDVSCKPPAEASD